MALRNRLERLEKGTAAPGTCYVFNTGGEYDRPGFEDRFYTSEGITPNPRDEFIFLIKDFEAATPPRLISTYPRGN